MPTAGEHNCFSELRDELAQVRNQLICAREPNYEVAVTRNVKCWNGHLCAGPRREQRPVTVSVSIPVQAAPEPGSLIYVRIEVDIVPGNLSGKEIPYQRCYCVEPPAVPWNHSHRTCPGDRIPTQAEKRHAYRTFR